MRAENRKTGMRPAQRDSGISILKTCPYRPYRPYRPLVFKTSPAQRDSGISKLDGCPTSPTSLTSPTAPPKKTLIATKP
jgi:hypothetical protein